MESSIKWHGGKSYLARKIISLMPVHKTYCETHAGALSVLLAKDPEGYSEIANDLNGDLSNFWMVMSNPEEFEQFRRVTEATPFSESLFRTSEILCSSNRVKAAILFFIHCRQSLAGRMKSFSPISTSRTRRGMNEQVSAWLTAVEGLQDVHSRLKRVLITSRDAAKLIKDVDCKDTFFYLDPPYLQSTRVSKVVYENEMSEKDHEALLDTLSQICGKFMISGYHSTLYDDWSKRNGLILEEIQIDNKASSGPTKRIMTECLWMNYAEHDRMNSVNPS